MNKWITFSLWLLAVGVIGTLLLMVLESTFGIINTFVGMNILVAIAGVAVILLQIDKYLKRRLPKWVKRSPYEFTKKQQAYVDKAMDSMRETEAINYFFYAISKEEDTITTQINKKEIGMKFTYTSFLLAYSKTIKVAHDYNNDWDAAYEDEFAVNANEEELN